MTDSQSAPPVYVIDEITARPGQGEALMRAYLERYAPGARRRGMTLVHQWVTPPYWLPEGSNRLLFVWSVAGAGGVWQMKFMARQDPQVAAWWDEQAAPLIESRTRSTCADAADLQGLADV